MGTMRPQREGRESWPESTMARRADLRPSNAPQRFQPIAIERLGPSIDGGEHPIKRIVGDVLRCSAEVFKDGHDLLGVALSFRGPGERAFREAPMSLVQRGLDEWAAEIALD